MAKAPTPNPEMRTPTRPDPLASLPRQDRHKPKGPPMRASKTSRWRAVVLIGVHVLIGLHILQWLASGSTVTPVEPSEAMETLELGKINAGFVLFAVLILGTLVLGRWFCGWGCHVVALQDLSQWLLKKVGLRPRPVRSRVLILVPFVAGFYMFIWPQLAPWFDAERHVPPKVGDWDWQLQTSEFWVRFPGPIMGVATFLVVGFLIIWWLGGKGFCTYGCPYGAFFGVADRFSSGRIRVTDACEHCGHCTQTCSSNVRVHEEVARHGMVVDPGCMKCMDCVSVCPNDALYYGFGKVAPLATSQQRIKARADFSWPEEILLAVVALVAVGVVDQQGRVMGIWRGAWFGEPIPFLMSLGCGVITAVFAVLALRLVTRRDVTFQHTVLRRGGALTRAGRWAALGLAVFWTFTLHTAFVRFAEWNAGYHLAVAAGEDTTADARRQAREQARDWLEVQTSWSLFADPTAHGLLGKTYRDLGNAVYADRGPQAAQALWQRAEAELRRANELEPRGANVALALCEMLNATGRSGESRAILERVLEQDGGTLPDPVRAVVLHRLGRLHTARQEWSLARSRLEEALRFAPDWPAPAFALTDVLAAQGEWRLAVERLLGLLAVEGAGEEAARRLETIAADEQLPEDVRELARRR